MDLSGVSIRPMSAPSTSTARSFGPSPTTVSNNPVRTYPGGTEQSHIQGDLLAQREGGMTPPHTAGDMVNHAFDVLNTHVNPMVSNWSVTL